MKKITLKTILEDIQVNLYLADGGIRAGKLRSEIKKNTCIAGFLSGEKHVIHPTKGIEFKIPYPDMSEFLGFTSSVFWTFPVSSIYNRVRLYDRYDENMSLHWMLLKRENTYAAIVPVPFRNMIGRIEMTGPLRNLDIMPENTFVRNEKASISIRMFSGMPEETMDEYEKCFVMATGNDPYQTVQDCFREFKAISGIKEKKLPAFVDYIGWCSWNSFYKNVSDKNLTQILNEFSTHKFSVPWILIDDGWELEKKQQLNGLEADKKKFPGGLSPFIKKIKSDYNIKNVGIWLPLTGHWRGLSDRLKKHFNLIKTNRGLFCSPEKSTEFFNTLYAYLKKEGVDFIKIDNLNGLSEHFAFRESLGKVYNTILEACGNAITRYFGKNKMIASMNQALEVVANLKNCAVFRNSDDYYPEDKYIERTSSHIIQNAFNMLWTREFGLPDCDMFFSRHTTGELHPVLRAISGGPVYFTDHCGEHDFSILRKFVDRHGKLLKPGSLGLPTEDCLFKNHEKYENIVKIFNYSGRAGLVAAFNPNGTHKINYTIKPGDIKNLKGSRFIIWAHISRTCQIVSGTQEIKSELASYGTELFTVAPIKSGIGIIGAVDKYISPAAVRKVACPGKSLSVEAIAGKRFIIYCEKDIDKVFINGQERIFKKNGKIIDIEIKEEI